MLRPLKQYGLATTMQRDLKTVSFLDITYDLQNNVAINHAVKPIKSLFIKIKIPIIHQVS